MIGWPNVSEGACQDSLTWLGDIASATKPDGVLVSWGFAVTLEALLVPSEFIEYTR